MKINIRPILIAVIITATAVSLLYDKTAVTFYKITEPYFGYPIKGPADKIVIRNDAFGEGDFGSKRRGGRTHSGIDILAAIGTPVYASKSGIAFRGNVPTGYGRYVLIYHPDSSETIYGHLSNWAVNTGQKVRKGDLVGFVGKTGNAANKNIEPHLHFEIRIDDEPVDPHGRMR